jgi:hypothetical protein
MNGTQLVMWFALLAAIIAPGVVGQPWGILVWNALLTVALCAWMLDRKQHK